MLAETSERKRNNVKRNESKGANQRDKRRSKIYNTAKILVHELSKNGVTVQRYNSKTSNSIYLKLDYGVLDSIRISDHKENGETKYKYNMLSACESPTKKRSTTCFSDMVQYYYPLKQAEELSIYILSQRNEKVLAFGRQSYKSYMDIKVAENYNKTGFWKYGEMI